MSALLVDYLNRRFDEHWERLMSALSDQIAEVKTSTDESIARVQADVTDLQAQIDDLKAKVATPEDLAALDAIQARLDGLDPVKPTTLPEGGGEPPAPAA